MTDQTLTSAAAFSIPTPRDIAASRRGRSAVIGALFPLGFLSYGIGFGLVTSVIGAPGFLATLPAHQTTLAVGAILMLLNTAVDIGKGVLMFPVLEAHGRRTALAYLAAMILEVALMAVGIVSLLLLAPLATATTGAAGGWAAAFAPLLVQSNAVAYQVAMITLAVANVFVWSLTYRVRLLPRALSAWGVAGYLVLIAGSLAELFGIPLSLMASIPGGLFEIALGVWLIARGFTPAAYSRTTA